MSELPKALYEYLEMRRVNARNEEEQMRERILVDLCLVMSIEEMKNILNEAKRDFKSKTRVNKLMFGKIEEVAQDTEKILKAILL